MEKQNEIEKERQERIKIKNDITELQQFYVDAKLSNLPIIVEKRKKFIIQQLMEFKDKHVHYKFDKNGNKELDVNEYLVSTYFFRSLNPIGNVSPDYSPENLSIVWDIYMYLIEQVNIEICPFNPSLTHFCRFAGISTKKLKSYANSHDPNMRELVDKIYDSVYEAQMNMAQNGKVKEKSTIWRLKTENDVVEKKTPNINVNISQKVDTNEVNSRLDNILNYRTKVDKGIK